MSMEKRNVIDSKQTPDFTKQASFDDMEKAAVKLFDVKKKKTKDK